MAESFGTGEREDMRGFFVFPARRLQTVCDHSRNEQWKKEWKERCAANKSGKFQRFVVS